jgi:hypothetical protein
VIVYFGSTVLIEDSIYLSHIANSFSDTSKCGIDGVSVSKTEALQVQRQSDDIIGSICLHEAKLPHKG